MSDDSASAKPARVQVTQVWLAQNRAKRLAYEEHRRNHARSWFRRGEPDEPEPSPGEPLPSGRARRSSGGKVHDKRQSSFDL